ncbi:MULTISPECIES: GNAT family N-acetyltransferase [unclassified Paenibacillus]|uniref:GNAT family N-acetyltransferase n=1 Tax=unclassified Paenibacillus TaxID=185978 RepID=UPI001AEB7A94|nr:MULTISPECIES: GNAT family N-acetyltransferase [unclassified Paenibacillus]MBP1157082.1 ribosomal protein S18 acetylase RimI-like enzyme [Paenibacillus sp. PvP091]MBP1172179.1 ribosomal protein S18 acetylase RimI-like enzyme [Paenibacillus sp. PvR098]MBP2438560.1 ribosomal protein S18 acetylase RimI-like enzyme [Paenibacillus sp. PvP052]
MLRKRVPKRDDGVICELVERLLLPFAQQTKPGLRLNRSTIRNRLQLCITFVDAAAGDKAAGFIALKRERGRLLIDMLAVNPKYQGQGIGSRLMLQAQRTANTYGLREIVLWVDEDNLQAQRFYIKHGYEAVYYEHGLRCYLLRKAVD